MSQILMGSKWMSLPRIETGSSACEAVVGCDSSGHEGVFECDCSDGLAESEPRLVVDRLLSRRWAEAFRTHSTPSAMHVLHGVCALHLSFRLWHCAHAEAVRLGGVGEVCWCMCRRRMSLLLRWSVSYKSEATG